MSNITWLIAAEFGHINGMVAAARELGGEVCLAVVGSEELAKTAAISAPDQLLWFAAGEDVPAEALAEAVSKRIQADGAEVILSLDDAISRVIWARAVIDTNAVSVGTVAGLERSGEKLRAKRMVADDRSIETVEVAESGKILAGIFNGDDADPEAAAAAITKVEAVANAGMTLVKGDGGTLDQASGLKTAKRVIGVGKGVSKNQLPLVRELAELLGAEVGCSLPVADNLHWFEPERVVGVTHNRISADFYIALGISGAPQHLSGTKDVKLLVAINTDPQAPIFEKGGYGIVGDVGELLPALLEAAKAL